MLHSNARYGWIPDLPDQRDHFYAAPVTVPAALPAKADLRSQCPPVYDQGELGSCTANAIAAAIQFDLLKQRAPAVFVPSRLFIYYNERALEHAVNSDSGAQIRDAIRHKAVLYQRLTPVLSQLKGCLASGYPFVFGFTVYESFESAAVAKSGHANLPASSERAVGGHAVVGVGYDDVKQWFIVRNSWGTKWGLADYFTLPFAYLTDENLAADFWTIRVVQ